MGAMVLWSNVSITVQYQVEVSGDKIAIWDGEGPTCFLGKLDEAEKLYPSLIKEMLSRKIIHRG